VVRGRAGRAAVGGLHEVFQRDHRGALFAAGFQQQREFFSDGFAANRLADVGQDEVRGALAIDRENLIARFYASTGARVPTQFPP
jgi:hypothetical protein